MEQMNNMELLKAIKEMMNANQKELKEDIKAIQVKADADVYGVSVTNNNGF
jgi:type II secretory pathway component PulC